MKISNPVNTPSFLKQTVHPQGDSSLAKGNQTDGKVDQGRNLLPPDPIGQIVQQLVDKGFTIRRADMNLLLTFLESNQSTWEQKVSSVHVMTQKKLLFDQLNFIHETLYGKPLGMKLDALLFGQNGLASGDEGESPFREAIVAKLQQIMDLIHMDQPSARNILEALQCIGMDADMTGKHAESLQAILEMGSAADSSLSNVADTVLQQIYGQHLVNKMESNDSFPSFFMNFPLLFSNKVKDLKVYIQSERKGKKIDQSDFTMVFQFSLDHLGDLQLCIHSIEKKIDLQIKNNQALSFQEEMESLLVECKQKMKKWGYSISKVAWKPFQEGDLPKDMVGFEPKRKIDLQV